MELKHNNIPKKLNILREGTDRASVHSSSEKLTLHN